MYLSKLDGDSESLQPSILLQPPNKFARFERPQMERPGDFQVISPVFVSVRLST